MSSKGIIPERYQGLRVVSATEMAAIDHRAILEFGIPALTLMENAGRGVAGEAVRFIQERLNKDPGQVLITVCCGRGNNGGDGLVAARYLKEKGGEVIVYIAQARREGGYPLETKENLRRAVEAGVSVQELNEEGVDLDVRLRSSDLLIDSLLGTGSSGKPAGVVRTMIQKMNRSGKPVVAVDIPSGIHPDTGHHSGVFIKAALTLTLGLPKRGLLAPHAQRNVGELKVLDIGFPPELTAA